MTRIKFTNKNKSYRQKSNAGLRIAEEVIIATGTLDEQYYRYMNSHGTRIKLQKKNKKIMACGV